MLRLALVIAPLIAFAGCQKENPDYCPTHPGSCSPDGSMGGPCKSSNDCTDTVNFPVCDTTESPHACVQCTANDHALCTGTTPACKDDSCAACIDDSDCGTGGLCLPNGACAASDNIIHASAGGTASTPCGSTSTPCSLTTALATVDSTRNVIKLDDAGPYVANGSSPNNNYTVNANVTIDARNATLHHNLDGPILTINNGKTMTLFGGKIEGATNAEGIQCSPNATLMVDGTTIDMNERSAITAATGCKLTVTNATINNNSLRSGQYLSAILAGGDSLTLSRSRLLLNKGGGVNVTSGTFVIVGNVFQGNGDVNSPNATVVIATGFDAMNRLEFNSIAGNFAQAGATAPGVQCAGAGFIARNNIIWGNNINVGAQIAGNCQYAYSDIGMMSVTGPNDAGNNLSMDPMFTSDLHLGSGSIAIKKADPNAKLDGLAAKDIDGDMRIAPADIGADQLPRP